MYFKYTILTAILVGCASTLNAFEVVRSGGHVVVSAPTCREVSEVLSSINQWNLNSRIQKNCVLTPKQNSHGCSVDATSCVPELVKNYQSRTANFEGPNCWSLVLNSKNILSALDYVDESEMAFYLSSPLCRPLNNSEPREAGDVGAIRYLYRGGVFEDHAFIHISEKLSFSKNGFMKERPYALQSPNEYFKNSEVPDTPSCHLNELSLDTKECPFAATSYFRCESMESYLGRTTHASKHAVEIFSRVQDFDKLIEAKLFRQRELSIESQQRFLQTVDDFEAYTKSADKNDFIVRATSLRLRSISEQLKLMGEVSLREKLEARLKGGAPL